MARNEIGIAGAQFSNLLENANNTLPVVYSQDIQGGLTSVNSETERLQITAQRLQEGQLVYQESPTLGTAGAYYRFTGLVDATATTPVALIRSTTDGSFTNANPASGNVTNALSWVLAEFGEDRLDELSDTNITASTDNNQFIVRDGSGNWTNQTVPITDLNDVSFEAARQTPTIIPMATTGGSADGQLPTVATGGNSDWFYNTRGDHRLDIKVATANTLLNAFLTDGLGLRVTTGSGDNDFFTAVVRRRTTGESFFGELLIQLQITSGFNNVNQDTERNDEDSIPTAVYSTWRFSSLMNDLSGIVVRAADGTITDETTAEFLASHDVVTDLTEVAITVDSSNNPVLNTALGSTLTEQQDALQTALNVPDFDQLEGERYGISTASVVEWAEGPSDTDRSTQTQFRGAVLDVFDGIQMSGGSFDLVTNSDFRTSRRFTFTVPTTETQFIAEAVTGVTVALHIEYFPSLLIARIVTNLPGGTGQRIFTMDEVCFLNDTGRRVSAGRTFGMLNGNTSRVSDGTTIRFGTITDIGVFQDARDVALTLDSSNGVVINSDTSAAALRTALDITSSGQTIAERYSLHNGKILDWSIFTSSVLYELRGAVDRLNQFTTGAADVGAGNVLITNINSTGPNPTTISGNTFVFSADTMPTTPGGTDFTQNTFVNSLDLSDTFALHYVGQNRIEYHTVLTAVDATRTVTTRVDCISSDETRVTSSFPIAAIEPNGTIVQFGVTADVGLQGADIPEWTSAFGWTTDDIVRYQGSLFVAEAIVAAGGNPPISSTGVIDTNWTQITTVSAVNTAINNGLATKTGVRTNVSGDRTTLSNILDDVVITSSASGSIGGNEIAISSPNADGNQFLTVQTSENSISPDRLRDGNNTPFANADVRIASDGVTFEYVAPSSSSGSSETNAAFRPIDNDFTITADRRFTRSSIDNSDLDGATTTVTNAVTLPVSRNIVQSGNRNRFGTGFVSMLNSTNFTWEANTVYTVAPVTLASSATARPTSVSFQTLAVPAPTQVPGDVGINLILPDTSSTARTINTTSIGGLDGRSPSQLITYNQFANRIQELIDNQGNLGQANQFRFTTTAETVAHTIRAGDTVFVPNPTDTTRFNEYIYGVSEDPYTTPIGVITNAIISAQSGFTAGRTNIEMADTTDARTNRQWFVTPDRTNGLLSFITSTDRAGPAGIVEFSTLRPHSGFSYPQFHSDAVSRIEGHTVSPTVNRIDNWESAGDSDLLNGQTLLFNSGDLLINDLDANTIIVYNDNLPDTATTNAAGFALSVTSYGSDETDATIESADLHAIRSDDTGLRTLSVTVSAADVLSFTEAEYSRYIIVDGVHTDIDSTNTAVYAHIIDLSTSSVTLDMDNLLQFTPSTNTVHSNNITFDGTRLSGSRVLYQLTRPSTGAGDVTREGSTSQTINRQTIFTNDQNNYSGLRVVENTTTGTTTLLANSTDRLNFNSSFESRELQLHEVNLPITSGVTRNSFPDRDPVITIPYTLWVAFTGLVDRVTYAIDFPNATDDGVITVARALSRPDPLSNGNTNRLEWISNIVAQLNLDILAAEGTLPATQRWVASVLNPDTGTPTILITGPDNTTFTTIPNVRLFNVVATGVVRGDISFTNGRLAGRDDAVLSVTVSDGVVETTRSHTFMTDVNIAAVQSAIAALVFPGYLVSTPLAGEVRFIRQTPGVFTVETSITGGTVTFGSQRIIDHVSNVVDFDVLPTVNGVPITGATTVTSNTILLNRLKWNYDSREAFRGADGTVVRNLQIVVDGTSYVATIARTLYGEGPTAQLRIVSRPYYTGTIPRGSDGVSFVQVPGFDNFPATTTITFAGSTGTLIVGDVLFVNDVFHRVSAINGNVPTFVIHTPTVTENWVRNATTGALIRRTVT